MKLKNETTQKLISFLAEKDTSELAIIIITLLEKLDTNTRNDFIQKLVLLSIESDLEKHKSILKDIDSFCYDCINGSNFNELINYNNKWLVEFKKYFSLAVKYAENGLYKKSKEIFNKLFYCVKIVQSNKNLLGTSAPMNYIHNDKILKMYFFSLKALIKNNNKHDNNSIFVCVEQYIDSYASQIVYINYLEITTEIILNEIIEINDYFLGKRLFFILQDIYSSKNVRFDKLYYADKLSEHNVNFGLLITEAYYEAQNWQKSIETAKIYLAKELNSNVFLRLNDILLNSYEKNNQFEEAYNLSREMLFNINFCLDDFGDDIWFKYIQYIRTRTFAEKINIFDSFYNKFEKEFFVLYVWRAQKLYPMILSYEGRLKKLIFYKNLNDENFELKIYTAKAIIYRALKDDTKLLQEKALFNLFYYIKKISKNKIDGIIDMRESDELTKTELLNFAISTFEDIVQYYIDADCNIMTSDALMCGQPDTDIVYYINIIVDIYNLLNVRELATKYIDTLFMENKGNEGFIKAMYKEFIEKDNIE